MTETTTPESTMTVRRQLHRLVDETPDSQLDRLREHIEEFDSTEDPFYAKLMASPEDDEPFTDEERAAVEIAREEVRRGNVVPWEQIKDTLG